jgi:hypothetical protein
MAGQFGLRFRLPRKSQGSFTCSKSATWDRRLYFASERRHSVDFFARKVQRLRPGSNSRSGIPEATMLMIRPPKPLSTLRLRPLGLERLKYRCSHAGMFAKYLPLVPSRRNGAVSHALPPCPSVNTTRQSNHQFCLLTEL